MRIVDIYFDYASPWSYLASELVAKKLPGVSVRWRPIYLRGLEPFANGLPYGPLKLAYLMRDVERVANHEGVTLAAPHEFPVDGLQALRGALLALDAPDPEVFARYHEAMFHAAWRDRENIADKETVVRILAEAMGTSEDPAALAAPALKARLRDATAAAIDRGVFGAPTFAVDDEIFWGLDRVDYVMRAASA